MISVLLKIQYSHLDVDISYCLQILVQNLQDVILAPNVQIILVVNNSGDSVTYL